MLFFGPQLPTPPSTESAHQKNAARSIFPKMTHAAFLRGASAKMPHSSAPSKFSPRFSKIGNHSVSLFGVTDKMPQGSPRKCRKGHSQGKFPRSFRNKVMKVVAFRGEQLNMVLLGTTGVSLACYKYVCTWRHWHARNGYWV